MFEHLIIGFLPLGVRKDMNSRSCNIIIYMYLLNNMLSIHCMYTFFIVVILPESEMILKVYVT